MRGWTGQKQSIVPEARILIVARLNAMPSIETWWAVAMAGIARVAMSALLQRVVSSSFFLYVRGVGTGDAARRRILGDSGFRRVFGLIVGALAHR